MANWTAGLAAHVDAGKTTLSEAMLYLSGAVRRQGRVDHGDAFLDTEQMEKERGRRGWPGMGSALPWWTPPDTRISRVRRNGPSA